MSKGAPVEAPVRGKQSLVIRSLWVHIGKLTVRCNGIASRKGHIHGNKCLINSFAIENNEHDITGIFRFDRVNNEG